MAMTSSPLMSAHHQPSTGSHPCSPSLRPSSSSLGLSSGALPPLPPLARPALPASTSVPAPVSSESPAPPAPSNSPRSYARAPTQRPYASPLSSRAHLKHSAMELCAETKRFADLVAHDVQRRSQISRHAANGNAHTHAQAERRGHSLPGSLAGSWEKERAELIVDIPVWSPGCFSDLSTLHALRDTTLAHTHALLGYMLQTHTIAGTYRLLTRSAAQQGYGWGCVRLAPQAHHPGEHQVLKQVDHTGRAKAALSNMARVQSKPARKGILDNAVYSDDEDEQVELKSGYRSGTASDEEEEVEPTDVIVEREIARRGSKEGTAFVMIIHGQPALILT